MQFRFRKALLVLELGVSGLRLKRGQVSRGYVHRFRDAFFSTAAVRMFRVKESSRFIGVRLWFPC